MLIRSALLTENASPGRPKLRSSFAIGRFVDIWPLYRARSSQTRILANHEPKGRGKRHRGDSSARPGCQRRHTTVDHTTSACAQDSHVEHIRAQAMNTPGDAIAEAFELGRLESDHV